jgi:antitoxin component of MazEF toxin-antitoxin module
LELDFEEELHEIEAEFDSERDLIVQKHASNVAELENVIAMIEQAHQDEETDKRQEFESLCEEVKNKNQALKIFRELPRIVAASVFQKNI